MSVSRVITASVVGQKLSFVIGTSTPPEPDDGGASLDHTEIVVTTLTPATDGSWDPTSVDIDSDFAGVGTAGKVPLTTAGTCTVHVIDYYDNDEALTSNTVSGVVVADVTHPTITAVAGAGKITFTQTVPPGNIQSWMDLLTLEFNVDAHGWTDFNSTSITDDNFGLGAGAVPAIAGTQSALIRYTYYGGDIAVTSNTVSSLTVTLPTQTSASIDATGEVLTVNFSEPVNTISGSDFALSTGQALTIIGPDSGSPSFDPSYSTWLFTISPPVTVGASPTLAYTAGGTVDQVNNALATFSGHAITNGSEVPGATAGVHRVGISLGLGL